MNRKEELQRIKRDIQMEENEKRKRIASEEKAIYDEQYEWAKQQMEEFADVIEDYFITKHIASYYFEIYHLFFSRYVTRKTDSPVSRKFLEIVNGLSFNYRIKDSFHGMLKKYLEERGIEFKFKYDKKHDSYEVWLEVI